MKIPRPSRYYFGIYPSFEKAKKRVQQAGIPNRKAYRKQCCALGLPYRPNEHYRSNWHGWADYLKGTLPPYETLHQASMAARALGITGKEDYRKRDKKDPRLPSSPETKYPDWKGWRQFKYEEILP